MTVEEIREAALRLKLSCAHAASTVCGEGRCSYFDDVIGCKMALLALDVRAVVEFALDGTHSVIENVRDGDGE